MGLSRLTNWIILRHHTDCSDSNNNSQKNLIDQLYLPVLFRAGRKQIKIFFPEKSRLYFPSIKDTEVEGGGYVDASRNRKVS